MKMNVNKKKTGLEFKHVQHTNLKSKNKKFKVLKCTYLGLQEGISELVR